MAHRRAVPRSSAGTRQPVQPRAQRRHGRGRLEGQVDRAGPGGEEPDRLVVLQRRHRVDLLAGHAQRLAAGDDETQVRALREQADQLGRDVDHLLDVVEQQQHAAVADVAGQVVGEAQHVRRLAEHQAGVAHRGERHPVDPAPVLVGDGCDRLQPEPGLAGPAGAGEREQPDVVAPQQVEDLGELGVPADERRGRHGQVGPVQALQRREVVVAELVDPLGSGQVLEPVLAEVAQRRDVRQPVRCEQRRGRGGDQHLPAVPAGRDPRRAVDVLADVALVGDVRSAGVHAHPEPDRALAEVLDDPRSRPYRSRSGREGEEERVALGVDLHPVVRGGRGPHQPPVLEQRRGVRLGPELVQQPRRALDVGEQERHRPRRQPLAHGGHGRAPRPPGAGRRRTSREHSPRRLP